MKSPYRKPSNTRYALSILFFFCQLCFASETLDFEVPPPPEAKLIETHPLSIGGRQVSTFLYESTQEQENIAKYYQDFFKEKEFKQILDKKERINKHLLRFKKEELVVSIALLDKGEKREVVIAKYLQPKGAPDIEELPPSVKDLPLPKEDTPGKDLKWVPRPPESIRWLSQDLEKTFLLLYATPLEVENLREFYKYNMASLGWQMQSETPIHQALEAYKKEAKKKDLIQSPFVDGENLEDVISQAYLLEFNGRVEAKETKVGITIFPNFVDKKLGSLVQIEYSVVE